MSGQSPLPHLAAPARRALSAANITCLEDLQHWRQADLVRLHGIGPNALKTLKEAMELRKVTFVDD